MSASKGRHVAPSTFENDRREHMAELFAEWREGNGRHVAGAPERVEPVPAGVVVRGLAAVARMGRRVAL